MECTDDLGWHTGLAPAPPLGSTPYFSLDFSAQDWWTQEEFVSYYTPPPDPMPTRPTGADVSTAHACARPRVSLACTPCRSRHAKCDAVKPACSQCRESSRDCKYAESGRTRAQKKRRQQRASEATSEVPRLKQAGPGPGVPPEELLGHDVDSSAAPQLPDSTTHCSMATEMQQSLQRSGSPLCSSESSRLLDQYYLAFHGAHPFILPRRFLDERAKADALSVRHVLSVAELIGALYSHSGSYNALRSDVEDNLRSGDLHNTGFVVQALMMFAIAEHSCNEFLRAREILDRAIRMAVQINMNSKTYSIMQGEGDPVLEESWRRTWWFLFVTDGMFAGQRRCKTFQMLGITSDVDLPCEEAAYESGDIPIPQTLASYEDRELTGDGHVFSSFAYLIGLGRSIGPALSLGTDVREPFDSEILSTDSSLVTWEMYLPQQKRLVIEKPGKLDEVMFLAHMLHNTLKVFIHRPQSLLTYSAIESSSRCAPPPPNTLITDQRSFDFHTLKVLQAAEAGIGLFSLPSSFTAHSPLVICGLTILILAQVSACRLKLELSTYASARDRVRLGLGAVKALSQVWKVGAVTMQEVHTIAQEMLFLRSIEDAVSV